MLRKSSDFENYFGDTFCFTERRGYRWKHWPASDLRYAWLEQFGFSRSPDHLASFERDRFCQSSSKLLTADLTYR